MKSYIAGLDFSPLLISLKTGVVATVFSFFLGIFTAQKVVRANTRVKAIADGILTLPMVLPPTVAGFFLLLIFSLRRPFGAYLYDTFQIKVVQTWLGCVLAATVIAFPLMYRNARAAFEQVDQNLIYAARTLGMSETAIFWKVLMPAARTGNCIRYDSDLCEGTGRVWCDLHACGQYPRQDEHDFTEDRNGHSGQ